MAKPIGLPSTSGVGPSDDFVEERHRCVTRLRCFENATVVNKGAVDAARRHARPLSDLPRRSSACCGVGSCRAAP